MSNERELPTFEGDALVLKFSRILKNQQGGFERRLLE
jgi:hypothetical protein